MEEAAEEAGGGAAVEVGVLWKGEVVEEAHPELRVGTEEVAVELRREPWMEGEGEEPRGCLWTEGEEEAELWCDEEVEEEGGHCHGTEVEEALWSKTEQNESGLRGFQM